MADLQQIPGTLNIKVAHTDDLLIHLNFAFDMTGYTFDAAVQPSDGSTNTIITVTRIDLTAGTIDLSLTNVQISALPSGLNDWYLTWTIAGKIRAVLAGRFWVTAV